MTQEENGQRRRRIWTKEEDARVIEVLKQHTKLQDVANELQDELDRTWGAIMNRARLLAQDLPEFVQASTRRRWTVEEDAYLRQHWDDTSPKELAEVLDRSVGAIKMRGSVLGLTGNRRS